MCDFPSSSLIEMEKWMEDIQWAIETAKTSNGPSSDLLTSELIGSSKCVHQFVELANIETIQYLQMLMKRTELLQETPCDL